MKTIWVLSEGRSAPVTRKPARDVFPAMVIRCMEEKGIAYQDALSQVGRENAALASAYRMAVLNDEPK